ncbi:MAG: iron-containing alcohol dehydrogenase [Rhodospirillales bacterium]|nr:MAG: iron-containing alcohol dehydrogenase [Rhodospirillales bacterium]
MDARFYAAQVGGEIAFTVSPQPVKFGAGALGELGADARSLGMHRVALFIDPRVATTEPAAVAARALADAGIDAVPYSGIRIEPTDRSFLDAAGFAADGRFDGFVSLGGGSTIDTAKAANLLATWPDDLLTYVNAPIGRAKPVPGPLKPHIACPTTAGTGSETTGVAVFDLVESHVKTGISSKWLKPALAVVDPTTTESLPAGVVACTGFDVFTHAIESFTARPFTSRDRPASPELRPPYQGSNPHSDIGAMAAIRLGARYLARAVNGAADREARHAMMFASTLAGLAFGNAGVHIPHAMSYAVAGLNHRYRACGYEDDGPMVPHGLSVVINAPAAFRFTAEAAPERHLEVAAALGVDVRNHHPRDAGPLLAERLAAMMRETGLPGGLAEIGYGDDAVPALVEGAFQQQRLLTIAPRPVSRDDLAALFRAAMRYW